MSWKPKHLGWKVSSITVAVGLWVIMAAQPDAVTNREVPLLFRNLGSGLLITGDTPDRVRVELRGPERRLTAESLSDTVAVFELADVKVPGERTFTVSTVNLNLPSGVTFLRSVPSQVRLRFDWLKSKDVPVEVRFTGSLPEGLRMVSRSVDPPVLRVAGSESRVAAVNAVETDAIALDRIQGSGVFRVNTFVNEPQVHFESSPVVTVSIGIAKSGN